MILFVSCSAPNNHGNTNFASNKSRGSQIMNFLENVTLQKIKNLLLVSRFYGVVVSTLDFDSKDPSSNLGGTCFSPGVRSFDTLCFCSTQSNHDNANEARESQKLKFCTMVT